MGNTDAQLQDYDFSQGGLGYNHTNVKNTVGEQYRSVRGEADSFNKQMMQDK